MEQMLKLKNAVNLIESSFWEKLLFSQLQVTQPPTDSVSSLSFSPKGNFLVATSWDNQVFTLHSLLLGHLWICFYLLAEIIPFYCVNK